MSVITEEALEQLELSPEEVEEQDYVEPKEIDNVNSPFAHMMANLLQVRVYFMHCTFILKRILILGRRSNGTEWNQRDSRSGGW